MMEQSQERPEQWRPPGRLFSEKLRRQWWGHEKVKASVTQSHPTLFNSLDYSPGSIHGILQARILEMVAIPFSRGSSQPRDWTKVSHTAGRFFIVWATREDMNEKLKKETIPIIWNLCNLWTWSEMYFKESPYHKKTSIIFQ